MPRQLTRQQFDAIVDRVVASAPPGLSEAQFDALVDAEAAKAEASELEPMRAMASHGPEREAEGSSRLATAGGMIGSLAGGSKASPVGIALAGLGGAAGQGVSEIGEAAQRPLVEHVSSGREALAKMNAPLIRMAQAGLEQAGMEGIGRGIGGALSAGGRRLYTSLLKPSKALRREHPDIVRTLLAERATISKPGMEKIGQRLGASADEADAIIAAASPTSAPVRAKEIVPEFADTVKELRKRVDIGQPSSLPEVGQRGRNLIRSDRGLGFDLTRAQALKRTAQEAASAGYRQAERGTVKEVGAGTMLDADVARGLRKAIEQRVPKVAAVNKRTQSLLGGKRALQDATEREANNLTFGMRDLIGAGAGASVGGPGGGAAGLALMRVLAQPRSGSAAAIGMNELSRIPYSQLLRMLEQAVQEQDED